ncbi:hypothetical protein AB0K60_20980 [Thermopolyspora sp. NPDC052614]
MRAPALTPRVGLVIADRSPEPVLAWALLDVARGRDLPGRLDRLLNEHLP